MVEQLLPYKYPVIIVNDGSEQQTVMQIEKAAKGHKNIFTIHREQNRGKGAAVIEGLKFAAKQGFTHAVQIDADNQHRVSDLPEFINAALANPSSLILGNPVFPQNTPKGRLYGRQISVWWVAVETLGRAVKDPLFGYRVYPLDIALQVINKYSLDLRMGFDLEIAVRIYWAGADIINIDTPVAYYEDGLSNFRMFRDNVTISRVHASLFLGMLLRFPGLILRRFKQ
jgi:glycosyltransferase involved in cell wall biosynthesis